MGIETIPFLGPLPEYKTTGRLEAGDFTLYEVDSVNGKGLGTLTRAIFDSDTDIADPIALAASFKAHTGQELRLSGLNTRERNHRLAALVNDVRESKGWLQGYITLIEAAPNSDLHPRIVKDLIWGVSVYSRHSKEYRRREPIDIKMEIGPAAFYGSIYRIGPKSGGGNAWKASEEYSKCLQRPGWRVSGYSKGLSPCVSMVWLGIIMKSVPREHLVTTTNLQFLGIVDYDLDQLDQNKGGFRNGLRTGAELASATGSPLQVSALVAIISYDFQVYAREIQRSWVAENKRSYHLGPEEASPEEWAAMLIADSAAIGPFAFETAEGYNLSRTGMITACIQASCHDALFDAACSNRVSCIGYAEAAGVAQYGMCAAFSVGIYEAIGQSLLDSLIRSGDGARLYYGHTTAMVGGCWIPFNTRYRSWERCVKYSRQLLQSKAAEAKALLELSHSDLILKDCDLRIDTGKLWAKAMRSGPMDFVKRTTVNYFIPCRAIELFETPGVQPLVLCGNCGQIFKAIMASSDLEEVHAFAGLPTNVTSCRSGGLAVGIRRAILWASNSSDCCEKCACKIGFWGDSVSYTVLSSLMYEEPVTEAIIWSLQKYFVGTVAFWPVSLPFLLAGFDLLADLILEDGAMGDRDLVDI